MRKRLKNTALIADINITPLVDVILVLLIIFMMITPLIVQSSINIHLPEAASKSNTPSNELVISVNKIGEVFLDNKKYNLKFDFNLLKFKLAEIIKKDKNTSIMINGDREVPYESVVTILDAVTELGARHILLGTETRR